MWKYILFVAIFIAYARAQCQVSNCFDGYLTRNLSNNKTIDIYYICYYHYPPQPILRQMWMLQGGPGGMANFDPYLKYFSDIDPNGLYCTTDYRGVGRSSELECTDKTQINCEVLPLCEEEIKKRYILSDFYTEHAANDVIELVKLMNRTYAPNAEVSLYGVSYGTFWLQKIMQINSNIAKKWIFDSVVLHPWFENGGWSHDNIYANELIQNYYKSCLDHDICKNNANINILNYVNEKLITFNYNIKTQYFNEIYDIFRDPDSYKPNNFVEAINKINELYLNFQQLDKILNNKKSVYCDINEIIYKIVKGNELYENNYKLTLELFKNIPFDLGTTDIYETIPWINEFVRDYRPIITNNSVLVMGAEYDIQTDPQNSIDLHNYFITNNVSSKIIFAKNMNHAVLNFKSNKQNYGLIWICKFILDIPLTNLDLSHKSDLTDFDTADYSLFTQPQEEKQKTTTELNGPLIATTVIIVVLLCVIAAMIGFYLHKKKIFMRFWMRSDNKNDIPLTRGG